VTDHPPPTNGDGARPDQDERRTTPLQVAAETTTETVPREAAGRAVPWRYRRRPRLDPEDEHRLLAADDYPDERSYLDDDYPAVPFEPADYLDDRGGR